MKATRILSLFIFAPTVVLGADRYWNNSAANGNWQTPANWSADASGTVLDGVPAGGDDVYFNVTSLTAAQTVSLNGAVSLASLNFTATSGGVTLLGGGTNRVMTLAAGLNVAAGAGAVTIGSATSGQNVAIVASANQTWTNASANTLTITNGVTASAAGTVLTIAGTGNTVITGIVGNGTTPSTLGLTKTGAGALTLSGANTYTGVTTLSGGTVTTSLNNGGSSSGIGASSAAAANLVFNGGTLDWTGGANLGVDRGFTLDAGGGTLRNNTAFSLRMDGIVTGSGTLTKTGSGSLALVNAGNDFSGILRVQEGIYAARRTSALGTSTAGSAANGTIVEAGATLLLDPSGTGGTGGGVTFTEHLTLRGGTLSNASQSNSWTGGIVLEANSILNSANSTLTIGSVISESGGSFGITKTGANTVSLTSANTFTGAVVISAGILSLGSLSDAGVASTLGASSSASSNLVLDGGTLAFGGNAGTNRGFTLAAGKTSTINHSSGGNVIRFDGIATGSGNLIKTGAGGLVYTNTANDYTGLTTINAGTVSLRAGTGTLGRSTLGTYTGTADGTVINASGTLQFDPSGASGSGVNLTINENITLNGGTLRSQSLSNTVAGPVTLTASSTLFANTGATLRMTSSITESGGSFGFTKSGAGTATIEGLANTFTGGISVTAGTLTVLAGVQSTALSATGGTLALGASNVLANGAVLTFGGGGTFSTQGFSETLGGVILTGDNTLALGAGASVVQFANSSANAWSGSLTVTGWTGSETGNGTDQLYFGTTAGGLTADQLALVRFVDPNGVTGNFGAAILATGEIVAVIPEPSVFGLVMLAGAGLVLRRTRGRRRAAAPAFLKNEG